jgi:hypothetical protein
MGAPTELELMAGSVIGLGIINETSTNNVIVEHANLVITQIGGFTPVDADYFGPAYFLGDYWLGDYWRPAA